jgi:hypothetical protein
MVIRECRSCSSGNDMVLHMMPLFNFIAQCRQAGTHLAAMCLILKHFHQASHPLQLV